jgi:hypothetical protein
MYPLWEAIMTDEKDATTTDIGHGDVEHGELGGGGGGSGPIGSSGSKGAADGGTPDVGADVDSTAVDAPSDAETEAATDS